jgi:hypothetical protein
VSSLETKHKVAIIIAFLLGYWAINHHFSSQHKKKGASSFSRNPNGLFLFKQFFSGIKKMKVLGEPILNLAQLIEYDVYILVNPQSQFSSRENKILREYVQKGGHLILSFSQKKNKNQFSSLLPPYLRSLSTKDDEDFKNFKSLSLLQEEDENYFKQNRTYSFYSYFYFSGEGCPGKASCFVRTKDHFRGKVTLIAGLSPFSNSLISREDNISFIQNLLKDAKTVLIDDFRHFQTDKTFIDLLITPSFVVPLFMMVVMGLLYFVFGFNKLHLTDIKKPQSPKASSMNEFNTLFIDGVIQKGQGQVEVVKEQAQYLAKIYPDSKTELEQYYRRITISNCKKIAKELIQFHQSQLKGKHYHGKFNRKNR